MIDDAPNLSGRLLADSIDRRVAGIRYFKPSTLRFRATIIESMGHCSMASISGVLLCDLGSQALCPPVPDLPRPLCEWCWDFTIEQRTAISILFGFLHISESPGPLRHRRPHVAHRHAPRHPPQAARTQPPQADASTHDDDDDGGDDVSIYKL